MVLCENQHHPRHCNHIGTLYHLHAQQGRGIPKFSDGTVADGLPWMENADKMTSTV